MKRLMVAASAAALSAAVFADVYNVKFTASALVDAAGNKATRKVKGVEQDYYKKTSVTVTGVYDDDSGETYFWTGSGKKLAPVQSAVFEITNDQEMDADKLTDAGKAVNVGLYIGQADNLTSYFVSGGIGKGALNTKNKEFKEWTADLASASGSFGGTWYGLPAYGSWSFSKNATATKNGIAEYVNTQGKSAGVTTANWTGTSDIGTKLDAWRKAAEEADTVSAMIKQIAALTGTSIDQAKQIAEQEAAITANKAQIAEQEAAIAENEAKIAANEAKIAANEAKIAEQQGQIDSDTAALEQANAELAAKNAELAEKSEALEKSNAELAAKIAELAQANADLGATLAELKALDNESFVGVIETISDYLKRVIVSQDALKEEAAAKIAAADKAIADYEEAVSDDFEAKLVEDLAAVSNAVDVALADSKAADKAVEKAYQDLDWLYNIKYDAYEYEYDYKTNQIINTAAAAKAAKQAEIDDALATYEAAKAALEGDNDTLIDVTLPGETNELVTVTIPALEDAKAATATAYEDAVADQADADAYLAEYTTEDGDGNYKKYVEDNGIVDSVEARIDFLRNVYPAMQKAAEAAAEATAAAKAADEAAAKDLADAQAELVTKTARLDALIEARENGSTADEIQQQLDDLKTAYEAEKAELEAELAEIGTKEEEDLAAAKKVYDDSYNYEHSDASLDKKIEVAEAAADVAVEAANGAWNVYLEALAARDEAEAALADVPGVVDARAAAVEAIIGVGPDAEDFEEKKAEFYADWGSIDETSAENVAAAKKILARLGKSVDEE